MILNENYGNLNKIDSTFLRKEDGKPIDLSSFRTSKLSPNSEIVLDKVKPHSIDGMLRILDDETNVAYIIRFNKKQAFLVTKENIYQSHDDYTVVITPYVHHILPKLLKNKMLYYNTKKAVKDLIKYILTEVSEVAKEKNVKLVWDALIIKADSSKMQKNTERQLAKQNVEVKPKEKDFKEFVSKLKTNWQEKCKEYLNSHMKNNWSANEIKDFLLKRSSVSSFMYDGEKYYKERSNLLWFDNENSILYSRPVSQDDGKYNHIKIYIKFQGYKLFITKITGTKDHGSAAYDSRWEELL